jgi:HEAT repeat protein
VLNALYQCLGDTSSQVRLGSIQALTYLGPPADPKMRQGLMNALMPVASKDAEPTVEIWANMSLMSLNDGVDQRWLKPILKYLKHDDPYVRGQAVQATGIIGAPKAKAAVPALTEMLTEPDLPLPLLAYTIWALGRMGTWSSDAIEPLQKIAADEKQPEPIRKAAGAALDEIQGKTKKTKGAAP